MRLYFSVFISICSFIIIIIIFLFLFKQFEVTFRYDYDYPVSCGKYDCGESNLTIFGIYAIFIGGMFSWRIFHFVNTGCISGELDYWQRLSWRYWILWFTFMMVIVYTFDQIEINTTARFIVEICVFFIFSYVLLNSYERKAKSHDKTR